MPSSRKQEILEVAQELIQSVGYAGFSYQDIATRLGIAKPSIHHHFATKESLAMALMEEYRKTFMGIVQAIGAAGVTPGQELSLFLDQTGNECHEKEHQMCPGSTLHANFETFPPSIQEAVLQLSNEFRGWITDVLRRGAAVGEIRFEGSPEDAALQLVSTCLGARMQARTHGPEIWDRVVALIKAQWLVPRS